MTISDALREFEARGYIGQFVIRPTGLVECTACSHGHRPRDLALEAMRRTEGPSDPSDMVFVGALRCPNCGQAGTAVMTYGPTAPAEHADVLRELDDQRKTAHVPHEVGDASLVHDSGWLRGPDG